MIIHRYSRARRRSPQNGQTLLPIVVIIGLFLLAMLGVAADYSQVWAHRQIAQGAADAACEAAAADLFLEAVDPSASGTGGLEPFNWITGGDFDCSTNTSSPPCRYASLNGYSGSNVHVSFPSSLPGVAPLPTSFATAHPYVEVAITDPVAMSFTKIVSSTAIVNIKAKAGCGVAPVAIPVPLVVLHQTAAQSLSTQGSGGIQILGGPTRPIQVDSRSTAAVNVGGSATVDLTQAGPNGNGGDFGVFGTESQPAGVQLNNGKWLSPATPIGDPWALTAEPSVPATIGRSRPVAFGTSGCPDPAGCVQFTAGDYSGSGGTNCATGNITYLNVNNEPNGCLILPITLKINDRVKNHAYNTLGEVILPANNNPGKFAYKVTTTGTSANTNNNVFPGAPPWNQTVGGTQADGATLKWTNIGVLPSGSLNTAIFDPGVFYAGVEGLQLGSGSTVRPSTAAGDGSGGPTFFFSHNPGSGKNLGTVTVDANSGKASACATVTPVSPANCIVSYKVDGTALLGVTSRALQCPSGPANPSQVPSKIDGNVLLGPCSGSYGSSDGKTRGFLFFQKRSTAVSANWGGGAGSLVSGFLYFHNTNYNSQISMSGGSSSAALSLGNMVADKVTLGGGSGIKMILNSQVTFQVLKPTLLE
jgi:Putative Flp pilus-assembly TadE/G-like